MAEGEPAPQIAYFSAGNSAEEQVALAWLLEEGTRRFYAALAEMVQDREAASLFRELVAAEEQHKETLLAVFEGLTGRLAGADFPAGVLAEMPAEDYMEGGVRIEESLDWTRGRQVGDLLELAIAVETNAYDRYLILRRDLRDENARRIFEILSDEEHRHLKKLTRLFDHFI